MASKIGPSNQKRHVVSRTCLCAPTTHPGSFRCRIHRDSPRRPRISSTVRLISSGNWELGYVSKSNWLRALLFQIIIKPSSHDLQRRRNFQPRPSRFCLMNNSNGDGFAVS